MRLLSLTNRLSLLVAIVSVGCSSSTTPAPAPDGGGGADGATDGGATDGGSTKKDSGESDSAVEAGGAQPTLLKGSIHGFSSGPPTGPAESNPYGLAVVPAGVPDSGKLRAGDILVSYFNGADGVQGTGTTVVRITPSGDRSTFFTSPQLGP